jgi:hypothetical protein
VRQLLARPSRISRLCALKDIEAILDTFAAHGHTEVRGDCHSFLLERHV